MSYLSSFFNTIFIFCSYKILTMTTAYFIIIPKIYIIYGLSAYWSGPLSKTRSSALLTSISRKKTNTCVNIVTTSYTTSAAVYVCDQRLYLISESHRVQSRHIRYPRTSNSLQQLLLVLIRSEVNIQADLEALRLESW